MKAVEDHKWRIVFSEGLSVVCLDPCPPEEQIQKATNGRRHYCNCYVGLEEPSSELCGEIDVSLEFRSLCTGHNYMESGCDCGWEFVITSATLSKATP